MINKMTLILMLLVVIHSSVFGAEKIKIEGFKQFGHSASIRSVTTTPDGNYLLSGSYDKTIKLWDIATGKEIRTFYGHNSLVESIAVTPDGKYVLSGSWDKTLKLWDIATGKEVRTFTGHTWWVLSVAITPDGKYALSGSQDKTLKLWDVTTGKEIRTFKGHTDWINSVAVTPDGEYALSGSDDKTIKLWEIATGKEVNTFGGLNKRVYGIAVTPDGKYALAGNQDQTIKLWDIATGDEVRTCSMDFQIMLDGNLVRITDPNQELYEGFNILHYAALIGDENLIKTLVESGAEPYKRGVNKWTPYHIAKLKGHLEAAHYLEIVSTKYRFEEFWNGMMDYCNTPSATRNKIESWAGNWAKTSDFSFEVLLDINSNASKINSITVESIYSGDTLNETKNYLDSLIFVGASFALSDINKNGPDLSEALLKRAKTYTEKNSPIIDWTLNSYASAISEARIEGRMFQLIIKRCRAKGLLVGSRLIITY